MNKFTVIVNVQNKNKKPLIKLIDSMFILAAINEYIFVSWFIIINL